MNNNQIISGFDEDIDSSIRIRLGKIGDDTLLVSLNGYLDTYNSNSFSKKTEAILKAGYRKIIFECSDLKYISSTGIGVFVNVLKQTKMLNNGDLVFASLNAKITDIFRLLGFHQFFTIKKTVAEAVEYLKTV